jgi:predicted membrane chloride channel (bestrophin family)
MNLAHIGSTKRRWLTGGLMRWLTMSQVDVNYDFRCWASHQDIFGSIRNWSPRAIYESMYLRRIFFPHIFFVGLSSSALCAYNHSLEHMYKMGEHGEAVHEAMGTEFDLNNAMLLLPMMPFTLTSVCMGFMLTFRTQNCNARYVEGRQLWGAMINESRAVSSRISSRFASEPPGSAAARARVHAVKCVMTFPHTLKYHLTADGFCPDLEIDLQMTDAEVEAAKAVALRKELASIWDYGDDREKAFVERLLCAGVGSRPLHVLHELSHINSDVFAKAVKDGGAGLHSIEKNEIDRSITRFQDVLGACERIYKTPIFTEYTKFTSRCTWLWCNLLPLALYEQLGPWTTPPVAVVTAFLFFGLEDIGTRIEEPFDSLPLWQYCDGIDATCKQLLNQTEVLSTIRR